jgi:hypothetical protein
MPLWLIWNKAVDDGPGGFGIFRRGTFKGLKECTKAPASACSWSKDLLIDFPQEVELIPPIKVTCYFISSQAA